MNTESACGTSLAVRVIPCLDVDAGRVVKGVNFENLRDAGDPVELAAAYDAEGADELTFLDVTASSSGRVTNIRTATWGDAWVSVTLTKASTLERSEAYLPGWRATQSSKRNRGRAGSHSAEARLRCGDRSGRPPRSLGVDRRDGAQRRHG